MKRIVSQKVKQCRVDRFLFTLLLFLTLSFVACAPSGKFVQQDFDKAVACLDAQDIPCALLQAEKLPNAEKARIRAYAYFKLQQYDAGIEEIDKAIKALQLRATPQAEKDIRHLIRYKYKMRKKQIFLQLPDTMDNSTE